MPITCNDSDVCTYLENILGFRQAGDADIHADTKATADLVQDSSVGLIAIQGLAYNASSNTDFLYAQEANFEALGITRNDYLEGILGIRQPGDNDIHADTEIVRHILTDAGHGGFSTAGLLSALGYPRGGIATPAADFAALDSTLGTLSTNVLTLLTDIVNVQTTLSNVALGIVASWPKSGGGNLIQAIGQWLLGQGAGPGSGTLTIGTLTPITSGALVSKPTGAYGLQLNLAVPASWGKISTLPDVFIPPVARVAQFSTWGTAGTPTPIETAFPTLYPLQPSCEQVSIDLGVGVTGDYAWLLL